MISAGLEQYTHTIQTSNSVCKQNVHYLVNNRPSVVTNLSQQNPIHIHTISLTSLLTLSSLFVPVARLIFAVATGQAQSYISRTSILPYFIIINFPPVFFTQLSQKTVTQLHRIRNFVTSNSTIPFREPAHLCSMKS
jgi:hypothetical protein